MTAHPLPEFHLLDDAPTAKDSFGWTSRVGKAVSYVIDHEPVGRAIAIEGTWGSGKSSVIRWLEEKYNVANSLTRVFVYDAWKHQRDPLRRSFLEALMSFLRRPDGGGPEWIRESTAEGYATRLSRRLESTQTTTTQQSTFDTVAIAVALLLLAPIGMNAIQKRVDGTVVLQLQQMVSAIYLLLSPLIAAAVSYYLRYRLWKSVHDRHPKLAGSKPGCLPIAGGSTSSVANTNSIRSPEPTSIEFCDIFENLAIEALRIPDRRLVIVMDNLDRLDLAEAKDTWATMRSFVEGDVHTRADTHAVSPAGSRPHARLWLVVPFDPATPTKLWFQEQAPQLADKPVKSEPTEKQDSIGKRPPAPKSSESLGGAFLDKTFQVRFRVPLPVPSDWSRMLRECVLESMPHHAPDVDRVARIFGRLRACRTRPPTPREIKLFVNRLCAYDMQWHPDGIPLAVQAAYVLLKDEVGDDGAGILRPDLIDDETRFEFGADWDKQMAALVFGVKPDKALEILLTDRVEAAITGEDDAVLAGLVTSDGARHVCTDVIDRNGLAWTRTDPNKLTNTALAVAAADLQSYKTGVWFLLGHFAERLTQWPRFAERPARGLLTLVDNCPDKARVLGQALIAIGAEQSSPESDEKATVLGATEVGPLGDGLETLVKGLSERALLDTKERPVRVPGSPAVLLGVVNHLLSRKSGYDKNALKTICASADSPKVDEHVSKPDDSGALSATALTVARSIAGFIPAWTWNETTKACGSRLTLDTEVPSQELAAVLQLLLVLTRDPQASSAAARETLSTAVREGALPSQLSLTDDATVKPLIVLTMLLTDANVEVTRPSNPSNRGKTEFNSLAANPGSDQAVTDSMADLASELGLALRELMTIRERSAHVQPLADYLIKSLASDKKSQFVMADDLTESHALLDTIIEEEPLTGIYSEHAKTGALAKSVADYEFDPAEVEFYGKVFDCCSGNPRDELATYLLDGLRGIPKSQWTSDLSGDHVLLDLAAKLHQVGRKADLGAQLSDALEDLAKASLAEDSPPVTSSEVFERAVGLLASDFRTTLHRSLRDHCYENDAPSLEPLLALAGNGMADPEILCDSDETADRVVRTLLSGIVSRSNNNEIKWATLVITRCPVITQKCKAHTKNTLLERIQGRLDTAEDGAADEAIRALADLLHVLPTPKPTPSLETSGDGDEPPTG